MKKYIFLIVIYCILLNKPIAQPAIGVPTIRGYTPDDYKASTEIWDVKQDKNGILYFANNDGLLTFDGNYWKKYPMPNKGTVKSILIDPSGRIFVGGEDEIGYFFPDVSGILKFHSIKNLLPVTARQFADVWDIVSYNNEIFFRTIECIFEFNGSEIHTFDAPGGWKMLSTAGSQLFAYDRDFGLLAFTGRQWQHCCDSSLTLKLHLTGIVDYDKDTQLVTTLRNGLFLLKGSSLIKKPTAIDAILGDDLVNFEKKIGNDRYAIGCTTKGLFIIDGRGNLVEHFSRNEGLLNNNVRSLLVDHDKNLWLGLENGLNFINYNTSVKHIYPDRENQAKSNAVCVFDNKLYIGTSNGLFSAPITPQQKDISLGKGTFTEVGNTKGQVWDLFKTNNNLIIGHQNGIMILQNNQVKPIAERQGAWTFKSTPPSTDIIAGTYTGLQLLDFKNGTLKDEGKIAGIYESLATLAIDDNKFVWASHRYRGIYKMELSSDKKKIIKFTHYTDKNGLPAKLNNHVYLIKNKIVAATEKGVYEYNPVTDGFTRSAFFKPIFGDTDVEYLRLDSLGNIWFISNQRVGVIDFGKPTTTSPYRVVYFPEMAGQMVNGFEYIYPYNSENIFMGSNNSIFHLNYKRYVSAENNLGVLLTSVKAIAEKDSLIFGGYFTKNTQVTTDQDIRYIATLPNHWNSFHFEYSSTLYAEKGNEEFAYKLIGFDKEWSNWSSKTEKDYTNLPYGWYTFSVKARNNLGHVSKPVNYTFIVKPASYQTVWAYLFYLSVAAFFVYYVRYIQQRRLNLHQQKYEEEQRRLSYLHSLELDRSEKEIIALKNDKLETELNYKNKELASITMHLVDRGRLLLNIKDELLALTKKLNIPDSAYQFRGVLKLLNDSEKGGGDWDQFAIYFDQVHNNFLSNLKNKFPSLSSTDLKLCAYLRLNLTSKEIAQLLNISLKGVEISRYRIRKKLNLSTDINLYDFLIEITK